MEEYVALGRHKGCKYGGTVFRVSNASGSSVWYWCNGKSWESVTFESIPKCWKHCGASSLNGDVLEVGDTETQPAQSETLKELYDES